MAGNKHLNDAAKAKKDEFYTPKSVVEDELKHYKKFFKDKVILCNCDDPYESEFFKYFAERFYALGLKKLIATCYNNSYIAGKEISLFDTPIENPVEKKAFKVEINDSDGCRGLSEVEQLIKNHKNTLTLLKGDGDFRSPECIELLKQADIVVTNPPFSLFREYVAQLMKYDKNFIVLGNKNAVTYKEIFPLIMQNKMWIGYRNMNSDIWFEVPEGQTYEKIVDGKCLKHIMACWYTNLPISKRFEDMPLYKKYTPEEYPKYDNYDAIEVSKTAEIPCDYLPDNLTNEDEGSTILTPDARRQTPDARRQTRNHWRTNHIPRQVQPRSIRDCGLLLPVRRPRRPPVGNNLESNTQRQGDLQTVIHQAENVTELLAYQSHSLTSTTQTNLKLSEQLKAKEKDSQTDCGAKKVELLNRSSTAKESTSEFLSGGNCNGVMGVPITFLDKYNPEQFEIVGMAKRGAGDPALKTKIYTAADYPNYSDLNAGPVLIVGGKPKNTYPRILIRRRRA